jgi:sarcosine oxidase subunit alpha
MTTTTDHAEAVLRHIEFLLQVTWPDLRVCVSDVTDQWAGIAVAGPRSRELLMSLFGTAVSADALPFMGFATVHYEQLSIMVLRVSFSGELGFELYVPSSNAQRLMSALCDAGSEFDIQPYGLDAMDILRIEKGHLTGAEIDGNRTLGDLGLTRMARNDPCYIGAAMSQRPGLTEPQRMTLVGLLASKAGDGLLAGAHLVDNAGPQEPSNSLGHVTSACFSPALQKHIALALLQNGQQRRDSTVYVSDPLAGTHVAATVVSPHFVDPAGERLRA